MTCCSLVASESPALQIMSEGGGRGGRTDTDPSALDSQASVEIPTRDCNTRSKWNSRWRPLLFTRFSVLMQLKIFRLESTSSDLDESSA